MDNLWISRPGCSGCVACQVLGVVVRQYAAARDVVCSAHGYLPDVVVRHNVAGGARELHGPTESARGYPPFLV